MCFLIFSPWLFLPPPKATVCCSQAANSSLLLALAGAESFQAGAVVLQLCCRVLTEGQVKPRAGYIKGGWCQGPSAVTQSEFKHRLALPLQPPLSTFKAAQDRIKSLAPGSKSRY